jgi:hypothetical protein
MSISPNATVISPVTAAIPKRIAPSTLFFPGLSVDELRHRVALVDFGSTFRIIGAEVAFTAEGIKRWAPVFNVGGVQIQAVHTLHQLSTAYATWVANTALPQRRRLALRVGKDAIPPDVPEDERLERRLLLTLARHLTIGKVDIVLTTEGAIAFANTLSNLGVSATQVTTLAQLAQLQYDEATLSMSRMLQPAGLAALKANYDARKKAAHGGLQNEG